MELICYPTSDTPPRIVSAPSEREWMDRTSGFAYRCLPLNIANGHGWMILNETPFFATWDGRNSLDSIQIANGSSGGRALQVESHFGFGVLTFTIACLFRTSPGYDLWVTGPVNQPKDGIYPLSAVVETDWSPTSFTMNWRFTREHARVWFDEGEPFCMIFPVQRGQLEKVEPKFQPMGADEKLARSYEDWSRSRMDFNKNLQISGSPEQKQKWQKNYFLGTFPHWPDAPEDHRTRLRTKPFRKI